MKELSIEEKAIAYDKAIERAKQLQIDGCSNYDKETIWNIFPELKESKESEDERIRKELYKYFSDLQLISDKEFSPTISIDEILAWLKKQNKHTKFTEKQNDTKLIKSIEVASRILEILLQSEKFQKDAREYLFDKGDKDLSGVYDIYAEEAVKYVKALFKQIENEY